MFSICRRVYSLIKRYSGVLAVIVNQAWVKGAEFLFPSYADSCWYVKQIRRGKRLADLKTRMQETINGKTAIGEDALLFIIIFPFSSQDERYW